MVFDIDKNKTRNFLPFAALSVYLSLSIFLYSFNPRTFTTLFISEYCFDADIFPVTGSVSYIADKDDSNKKIDADSDATWRKAAIIDGGLGMSK